MRRPFQTAFFIYNGNKVLYLKRVGSGKLEEGKKANPECHAP